MKKNTITKIIIILFFLIFTSTPYAFREIAFMRGIFIVFRFLNAGTVSIICLYCKKKWNEFDISTLLFCTVIVISALHAGFSSKIAINSPFAYLHGAYSYVVFIVGQLLIVKIIFDMQEKTCLLMMKTFYGYYLVFCLINLFTQIAGLEIQSKTGNVFFLGMDNDIGKYYLIAFFYGCVVMALEEKKFSYRLILITVLTLVEGIYRKIGGLSAISFLMIGLVLLFFFTSGLKIWKLRQDIILGSMVSIYMVVMILYSRLDVLQTFINRYLYGKASALATRFQLQIGLLEKWPESPIWGSGAILSQTTWEDTPWFDYALRGGNAHNYLIEALCNFGIFAFILFVVLLILGIRKMHKYSTAVSFVGVAFFLVLLRGMFENRCQDIFAVLPTMYYLGEWCAKKYKSFGDAV